MRKLTAIALLGAVLVGLFRSAYAEVPTVRIGETKPTWIGLIGTDGKPHSLADFAEREVVVIAVTCNHCPIAIQYYDRMKAFAQRHAGPDGKVGLVAISVSNLETDKLPRMKEMHTRRRFNFPYLYDGSQEIARNLGATVTPQFFILNKDRVLVYRGAWDDSVNESWVKVRYVEDAVAALLAGKTPPTAETKPRGCLIEFSSGS